MSGREHPYIQTAFGTDWQNSLAGNLEGFEREIGALLASRPTLACASGTAALHLILRYLDVGEGDEVVVSTLTFAGSVFPIQYVGARPVFIDSERTSGNMDVTLLGDYLERAHAGGKLPKAVIVVHLYGQHADLDAIRTVCARFAVPLIEDSAESLGSTYKGRQTGTTGDFAVLSFNLNKMITTTGGGMVVATDPEAIARMRKWANQSRENTVEYLHREIGFNYRMSNVVAGIGRGQLEVLPDRVAARRAVAERYTLALADVRGVSLQPEAPWGTHSRWLSVFYIDPNAQSLRPMDVIARLAEENIEARPVWRPMHTQPLFEGCQSIGGSVAEGMFATGLCLPSSSNLSLEDQDRVVQALRRIFL
jgi:pyridoxal phosphate-dependent aminotransferase EpsN